MSQPMPTTKGKACDARPCDSSGRRQEPECLRGTDEFAQSEASFGQSYPFHRVDPDAFHPRKVDDDPPITDRIPAKAVAAAPDGDGKIVLVSEFKRPRDVGTISTTADQRRVLVNRPIPNPAGLVVANVAWTDQFTAQTIRAGLSGHSRKSTRMHTSPS
jgi:hypothetical protein